MKRSLFALPLLALAVPHGGFAQRRSGARSQPAPAPPLLGEAARESARLHFARGVEQADARRWREAIAEFEQARTLAASPAVYFNLAAAYQAVARRLDAIAAYEAFLQGAGAALSSERQSQVRAQLAVLRSQLAHLDLVLEPADAEALLDEVPLARSARPLELDPGRHQLVVVSQGRASATRALDLVPGATVRLRVTLPAAAEAARLIVEAQPSHAMIRIDGQNISQGRADEALTAGEHLLEVTAYQHGAFRRALTMRPGVDVRLRAVLEDQRPIAQNPWFWAVTGTVAAGLALGLGLGLGLRQGPAFQGTLSNVEALRWER